MSGCDITIAVSMRRYNRGIIVTGHVLSIGIGHLVSIVAGHKVPIKSTGHLVFIGVGIYQVDRSFGIDLSRYLSSRYLSKY